MSLGRMFKLLNYLVRIRLYKIKLFLKSVKKVNKELNYYSGLNKIKIGIKIVILNCWKRLKKLIYRLENLEKSKESGEVLLIIKFGLCQIEHKYFRFY